MSTSPNPDITVSVPGANGNANVAPTGLCVASGTKSDDLLMFQAVWLRVFSGHVDPTPAHFQSVIRSTACVDETWRHFELESPVFAGPATLMVVGEWVDQSSMEPEIVHSPPTVPLAVRFNAVEVMDCAAVVRQPAAGTRVLGLGGVSASSLPVTDLVPIGYDDGWIRYNLTLNNRWGNRLLLPDRTPLSAKKIAVAATTVHWHHSNSPYSTVQKPFGTMMVRSTTKCVGGHCSPDYSWNYFEAPAFALVLAQMDRPDHCILSQDKSAPDIVNLDSSRDIIVNVNNIRSHLAYSRHSGAIEIAVKVIF